jgi:hypothetical protein
MTGLKRFALPAAILALSAPVCGFAEPAAAPAASGSPVEQAGAPMPANLAQLDKALTTKDYASINRIHGDIRTYNDILLFMNWEQVRVFNGEGGVYLSLLYMDDLWILASALEKAGPSHTAETADMKQTSVFMGLYSYELIVLDGVKCTDSTAVGHRMDQLTANHSDTWAYISQIPEEMRAKTVWAAITLEAQTEPKRRNDDVLCQGGMVQMIASLAAQARSGQQPQEVPNQPGMIGKSFAVPPPKDFEIGYVRPDIWRPQQAKLRESMPTRLAAMMKVKEPYIPPKP